MGKKMLIDAAHREETRVAIVSGNRVENFDFESEAKRPLRGNIYLAKVTRVEPSLQAAFIEYGGNRHGFLAFSEIHPDYYQIPVADREKLLAEEAADAEDEYDDDVDLDDEDDGVQSIDDSDDDDTDDADDADTAEAFDIGLNAFDADEDDSKTDDAGEEVDAAPETIAAAAAPAETVTEEVAETDEDAGVDASDETADDDAADNAEASADAADNSEADNSDEDEPDDGDAETGEADADGEEASDKRNSRRRGRGRDGGRDGGRGRSGGRGRDGRNRSGGDRGSERRSRRSRSRHYKIQEVIKRRQILLVQVVKEERGNKGAALTTYLSLAGRYCVLMPNTARGGGISRKITNASDRRRLKEAMSEMDVADGMGLIVRTAGANRTKVEIKRDFDYLLRLWENIRDLTLKSSAPCLIYEEGDLIKRSIRDQYTKDIDEIVVDGDRAYKDAKDFMRMLMPSHAKNVKRYKDRDPLLQRYGVQSELDSLLEPTVTLRSGGYIVINPTEALVSIDVNSGKSTKEHNIEATALSTNMEAAEEISRQLRLRDMAGLIVIDFIDMDEPRNNRAVERKLKDSLKQDRARIQVGRISSFGLLEMSRQRMRSGVLEGSTDVCPHCKGTGVIRSTESAALQVLRAIEAEALKGRAKALDVNVPVDIAVFILNQKRASLLDIEKRCRVSVYMVADGSLIAPDFSIKRTDDRTPEVVADTDALSMESAFDEEEEAALDAEAEARAAKAEEDDAAASADAETDADADGDAEAGQKPKRRRRRRRKPGSEAAADGGSDDAGSDDGDKEDAAGETAADEASDTDDDDADGDGDKPRKRRRRGRRGGRRHRRTASGEGSETDDASEDEGDTADVVTADADTAQADDTAADETSDTTDTDGEDAPILVAYSAGAQDPVMVAQPAAAEAAPEAVADTDAGDDEVTGDADAEDGVAKADAAPVKEAEPEPEPVLETADAAADNTPDPSKPTKRGWWQRKLSS
jgi:ribonuclease E